MKKNNSLPILYREIEHTGLAMARGSVYKYKSLENEELISHVIELITTQKIYCPKPSTLNDCKEFKPQFTVGDLTNQSYKSQVDKWVRRTVTTESTRPTEQQIQEFLKNLTKIDLEDYANQLTVQYQKEVDQRYKVISLSTSATNHRLWTKYSDNYKGICFEFIFPESFVTVYKVHYDDSVKTIELTSDQDFDHLRMTGLVKDKEWEDENEVRLILADPPIRGGERIIGNKLLIPSKFFKRIYFGYKIDQSLKETLISLINSHLSHVMIYEVYEKLEISTLRIN